MCLVLLSSDSISPSIIQHVNQWIDEVTGVAAGGGYDDDIH